MNTTSPTLLERLRQPGAQDAWRRFADLYTPLFYHWAHRLGMQEPDAADLVQDFFAMLLRKLPEFTYDSNKSFRRWLHTALINEWRARRRKRVVIAAGGDAAATLEVLAVPDDVAAFGEEEYRKYLSQRALRLMQREFQDSTWRACWGQVVEGRTAAEVGKELGISEGAAYVAKCRVLRRLRQELAGLTE